MKRVIINELKLSDLDEILSLNPDDLIEVSVKDDNGYKSHNCKVATIIQAVEEVQSELVKEAIKNDLRSELKNDIQRDIQVELAMTRSMLYPIIETFAKNHQDVWQKNNRDLPIGVYEKKYAAIERVETIQRKKPELRKYLNNNRLYKFASYLDITGDKYG